MRAECRIKPHPKCFGPSFAITFRGIKMRGKETCSRNSVDEAGGLAKDGMH